MSDETLIKHFNLLQQEFQKINNKYQLLKRQYDQLAITTGNCLSEDNFLINLNKIVRGLYKDKKYSDIFIKLEKTIIPGHKIVFEANGGDWCGLNICDTNEINLENEDQFIGEQIIKWLYLQELDDKHNSEVLWKIIKVSHEHGLNSLKSRCESSLLVKVTKKNCIYFYMKAYEMVVENLANFCSDLIISNWNDYQPSDFDCLSASIFLELLELHSSYPLHDAVKANRDDVVFLYINENFSELEELVNVINEDNEIVLDLALISKRVELCQTLLANCANPNGVDNNGWSLLHLAILRFDEFAACFLIQNGCHLNPITPEYIQTPLQLICHLMPENNIVDNIDKLSKIGTMLIQSGADVNHVDNNDMTALCLSILSGNELIMTTILNCGRCTTVNGANVRCNNSNSFNNNKNKMKTIISVPRVTSYMNIPPLPLWLAVCREYRPQLLDAYKEFREDSAMKMSPTYMLIEYDGDPGCLYDSESGNSIIMELISQNMEDAAIFVLETFHNRQTIKNPQMLKIPSTISLINMTNNFKESLLHLAVENELLSLCKLLLELGADPNKIRRKTLVNTNFSSKDDISSSCDSMNSLSSFKEETEINTNNESYKPVYNNSSDSVISSWSSKTEDLNPFKEFMKSECEEIQLLSLSLPLARKSHQNRGLLGETIFNKKPNKETIRPHRCKLRHTKSDKQLMIDLSTPTHLAIKSKNLKLINLFINHNDNNYNDNDNAVNWLLLDGTGESPFTLTLWNSLISVADMIFRKLIKNDFKTCHIDQINIDGQYLLHLAVLKDNIETVQFLIKIGCDINIKNYNGITPLLLATERLNIEIVKVLCLSGADCNVAYKDVSLNVNGSLICPLWVSIINNRFDIADILTKSEADVDMWSIDPNDDFEQTLLHRAILEKKDKAAIFLISHDCDIRSPREHKRRETQRILVPDGYVDGNTPLHMACQNGLDTVVKTLLSCQEIDCNAQNNDGLTALHLAIRYSQEIVLEYLLDPKYKLNLSIRDNQGHTPFHTAMEMSNQKAAGTILQYHPNAADEVDNYGRNFLHVAVQAMNREAVFFLIQVNANLNVRVKDSLEYTPLHLCIISGAPEDMIRSLILAGARIEDETIEKHNLLHLAVIYERTYLISFLLENGASISHQDNNFETPLHLAIKGGNKDIIEPLLVSSASTIRMKNLKGENILHILSNNAKENAVVIFSLIMENFPDFPIDEKDACGNTALFLCAFNGHVRLAVAFMMKGSSFGCVNNDGSTLFNCDSISEQLLMKLLDSLDTEPNWLDGEICVSCLCKFSIKNRKHHCRHCGRLVCGKCSMNEIPIIKFNIKKSVRVCEVCFNFIVSGKIQ